jgi:polyisoprenoid-binding protein YceI
LCCIKINEINTQRFPEIIFAGILHRSGDAYALTGNLTIHGVQQPITLAAEFTGTGKGFGDTRAGFELSGKLNRKDFGLSFNMLTETGGLLLGEEIKLHFDVQLIREEAA